MMKAWKNFVNYIKPTLAVTQNAYYLRVSNCPLDAWEQRFIDGNKAVRLHTKTTMRGRLLNSITGKRLRFRKYTKINDYEAWCMLFDNFRDVIGLDPDFEDYLNNRYLLLDAREAFILSKSTRENVEVRDRRYLNLIKKLEVKIKLFEDSQRGNKTTVTSILISLYRGEKLPLLSKKNLTVEEYFTLIATFNKKVA